MEREDYLKKQIDQIGRILGKILVDFLGLQSKGQAGIGIELANQALKSELDFDIQELTDIPTADFMHTLIAEKKFTDDSLEKLAEILLFIADNKKDKEQKALYEKCLTIFEHLEKVGNTCSLDRM
ncbi:MAG: hypothetical protein LBK03_00945 [Bacteroidales bacterium]|nr:hypothetical protein [Bacteroidales bacterium]